MPVWPRQLSGDYNVTALASLAAGELVTQNCARELASALLHAGSRRFDISMVLERSTCESFSDRFGT